MILSFEGNTPEFHEDCFIAASADLVGAVCLGQSSSVWFSAVLRADSNTINVGKRSNIQDHCILHVDQAHSLTIGDDVSVGHRAILHGCTIKDRALIGMGAVVMNGAIVGEDSLVAAGALVSENTIVPPRSLVLGVPAKVKRELSAQQVASLLENSAGYTELAERYRIDAEKHPY